MDIKQLNKTAQRLVKCGYTWRFTFVDDDDDDDTITEWFKSDRDGYDKAVALGMLVETKLYYGYYK